MFFTLEERPSDSSFVQAIWRNQSERSESFISTAGTHWEMVWMRYKCRSTFTLRGPEMKATPADLPADAEWLGITFKLGTFMPDFLPGSLLDRQDVNLPEATGTSFWLCGSTWNSRPTKMLIPSWTAWCAPSCSCVTRWWRMCCRQWTAHCLPRSTSRPAPCSIVSSGRPG